MIYTASYSETNNHHGKLIPISASVPKGFKLKDSIPFFIPNSELLKQWKAKKINKNEYTDIFREQTRRDIPLIKEWLKTLDPRVDMTLLCWEKTGDFCHRNLVIKLSIT